MVRAWWTAFLLTLALETPVYAAGLRRSGWRAGVLLSLLANGLTHPLAWHLTVGRSWTWFVAVELGVWATEAMLIWGGTRAVVRAGGPVPPGEAVVVALTANALSAGVGLLSM
jgi:hypothetical protein